MSFHALAFFKHCLLYSLNPLQIQRCSLLDAIALPSQGQRRRIVATCGHNLLSLLSPFAPPPNLDDWSN